VKRSVPVAEIATANPVCPDSLAMIGYGMPRRLRGTYRAYRRSKQA
jgi:hypothetical protein